MGLTQAFRNIWNHGDDNYAEDETEESDVAPPAMSRPSGNASSQSYDSQNPRAAYGGSGGGSGGGSSNGGSSSGVRRLRPVAPSPLRARDKNIYTLRPKSQEDAAIAADALKAGDAVIINLEEVERVKAVRIIDFMSGVCYGLEGQGHAMKLGELIFLYTPPEFEIVSDETDYGENPDFYFKDVEPTDENAADAKAPNSSQSATIQNVGAPVVTQVPLNAQVVRGAQTPQSSTQSSTIPAQSSAAQPIPQQNFSPQSFSSGERRPWER